MASIELEDKTAEVLLAWAKARNLSLDTFLKELAQAAAPLNEVSKISVNEFERLVDSVVGDYPSLPERFSRADIYSDHD